MTTKTLEVSRDTILTDVDMIFRRWTDGSKHLISHYLSPIEFRQKASFTGTDHELIEWVKNFPYKVGAIYVVSDHDIVYHMKKLRPSLVFSRIKIKDVSTKVQKQDVDGARRTAETSEV